MPIQTAEQYRERPGVFVADYHSMFRFMNDTAIETAGLQLPYSADEFACSVVEASLSRTRFRDSLFSSEQSYLSFDRSRLPISPASYAIKSTITYSDELTPMEKLVDDNKLRAISDILGDKGYSVGAAMSADLPEFLRFASRSLQIYDADTASKFGVMFSQYGSDPSRWGISTELTEMSGMYLHIFNDTLLRKQFDRYTKCYGDLIHAFHTTHTVESPDFHIDFHTPQETTVITI